MRSQIRSAGLVTGAVFAPPLATLVVSQAELSLADVGMAIGLVVGGLLFSKIEFRSKINRVSLGAAYVLYMLLFIFVAGVAISCANGICL